MSDMPGYVGPDVEWNADNPPKMNMCCGQHDKHADDCDGSCDQRVMSELEVELTNEMKKWAREKLPMVGVPEIFMGQARGFIVHLLDLQCLVLACKEVIEKEIENGSEKLDHEYQTIKLFKLRNARAEFERSALVPKMNLPPIIGPNGGRLN